MNFVPKDAAQEKEVAMHMKKMQEQLDKLQKAMATGGKPPLAAVKKGGPMNLKGIKSKVDSVRR